MAKHHQDFESPAIGAFFIAFGAFIAAIGVGAVTVAALLDGPWLGVVGILAMGSGPGFVMFGWREIVEGTAYRKAQEAWRERMAQAGVPS